MLARFPYLSVIVVVVLTCSSVVAEQKKGDTPAKSPEESAKKFVSMLDKGEFDKAANQFDAEMLKAMPADKLKETWEKIVSQAGAYKSQLGTRSDKADQYDIVYVTCEFAKLKVDAKVVFDDMGKISGLFFTPAKNTGTEEVWEGTLKAGAANLRLVFHLFKQKDGSYTATMDSPDQGAAGIPLDDVSVKGDSVRLGLKSASMVFEGTKDKGGKALTGEFKQAGQTFPLTLNVATKKDAAPTSPAKSSK